MKSRDPYDPGLSQRIVYWSTNVWVIVIVYLILAIMIILILAYIQPEIVLDNGHYHVDNARLVLTALIVASIIIIAAWLVIIFVIKKFGDLPPAEASEAD